MIPSRFLEGFHESLHNDGNRFSFQSERTEWIVTLLVYNFRSWFIILEVSLTLFRGSQYSHLDV
jgi:hypothetical protein